MSEASPAGGARTLFIVEREFLREHVGVRRVILHYARAALRRGEILSLATPDGRGHLLEGFADLSDTNVRNVSATAEAKSAPADWTSAQRMLHPHSTQERRSPPQRIALEWTDHAVRPEDFDRSVLTAPWVCRLPVPATPNLGGIVYDMVPNLLSLGALHMPVYAMAHHFAHQHHLGYQHLLDHASRILCISASTRDDFLLLYGQEARPRIVVDIPYAAPPLLTMPAGTTGTRGVSSSDRRAAPRVLMVNVFDPRKNITNAVAALLTASRKASFAVSIVGRERMPLDRVLTALEALADAGLDVSWYRDASDAQLDRLYHGSSVLLFPSLYEGLGLPILEAQAAGLPVVSSDA
ncbi:MAG: glycosyltransferase, partial [Janthinobacterium lividum]